ERRIQAGTHFAAPTEDAVTVAEELQRRWGLPKWRYTNSGTEATMDAVRIARGLTGRDTIVKIFGSYHGHNDALMVSTGGAGVATERFGVRPDLVTLAKSLGGGLPSGAIGGTDEAMRVVEDGSVYQVGTFNGNPLSMAAARANLEEVLTPPAYEHLDHLNERILNGCARVIEEHKLPGHAIGIAAKDCVTFATDRIVDYASFSANQDAELTDLAWLYSMNRGIFMTPGREEEWTLTVAHDDAAV